MLEIYAQEFVGIGNYLRRQGNLHKGYVRVKKDQLIELLDQNNYDRAIHKLQIWKSLKWIDTDADGRLTKRVYEAELGYYKPYVMINAMILDKLQELLEAAEDE